MLLIFEFGYAIWRYASNDLSGQKEKRRPFPSYEKIALFILILAIALYLIRIVLPVGVTLLGFPSLFDLPQYLSLFIVGLIAARGDWLRKMPISTAKRVFGVALIATLTLFVLAVVGTEISSLGWGSLIGQGSLSSAFYASWEAIWAVGMTMFAIFVFRRYFNSAGRFWKFFSQHFYTAYIIAATIIVSITAVILSQIHIASLLKFGLASVIILPLIWAAAFLVRKIPFADRVL
jgi:hypothetical protein